MLHPAEATLYPREVEAWWRDLEQSKVHLCAHPSVRPSVCLSMRRRWRRAGGGPLRRYVRVRHEE